MNTIYFRNQNQVTLFRCELQGQLSDGHWENSSPRDHWMKPCGADVLVAENDTQLGCNFLPRRRYNFANKDLLDVVADRMLHWVRFTTAFPTYLQELDKHWDWDEDKITHPYALALIANVNYTKKDLVRDLKDMGVIFGTMRSGTPKATATATTGTTTLKDVKSKISADSYSFKEGVFTLRWSYFYTHGRTTEMYVEKVKKVFPNAVIVGSGNVWKAFKGSASVANQSHWYVKFTL